MVPFQNTKKSYGKTLRLRLDGGVEKWEDGKLWEDGKYLVFPLMCLVGEKNGRMENVIYVN